MQMNIPYLYINVVACCCFLLILTAFSAAKKSQAIWAFIAVLTACVVWSGSSILMRLQMWPGHTVWFYLSLVALFTLDVLFFWFVYAFYHQRNRLTLSFCILGTLAILPGTVSGFYLAPPTPVVRDDSTFFVYTVNWHIVIPCVLFLVIIALTSLMFLRLMRQQGVRSPGLLVMIWGGLILLLGNILQVAIPGNTFPYDALSGILFAGMLLYALYKRRMFRVTLLVSRGLLMVSVTAICLAMAAYLITPVQTFAVQVMGLPLHIATLVASLLFAAVLALSYQLLRKVTDAVFARDEWQGKRLQQFTAEVSRILNTGEIMEKMSGAIMEELPIERVYVFLKDGDRFTSRYCSSPLTVNDLSITGDSPQVKYLQGEEKYLIPREFESHPLYLSVWASEKELFSRLNVGCAAALRDGDEIIGLVLLSAKERDKTFSYSELSYLNTICSVASIAMKNAGLYEQVFNEARIDPLTGVYNYRYFTEQATRQFEECRQDCLSLLYADIDDFKLYNQLYGVENGDDILCRVAQVITQCVGDKGSVYRTSGKVFAVLLPNRDAHYVLELAEEIRRRVLVINQTPERRAFKPVSVSIGVCSAPYAAATAKEMINNADLATFNAKQGGKDRTVVFRRVSTMPRRIAERTDRIVERTEMSQNGARNTFTMISALTAAIDAKDHYTYAHSKNVARYAANLAVAAGLNDEQVSTVYAAGLLHDVGKISIPEVILNKTGKLTDDEYSQMKDHVNNSIEMIRHLPGMDYLIPAVLGHHERWDGKGYPSGIAGEDIPVAARCLAVADVFDAMTTDRPYRKGLPLEYALDQLRQGAGNQLDPKLAALFIQLIQDGEVTLSRRTDAR